MLLRDYVSSGTGRLAVFIEDCYVLLNVRHQLGHPNTFADWRKLESSRMR